MLSFDDSFEIWKAMGGGYYAIMLKESRFRGMHI